MLDGSGDTSLFQSTTTSMAPVSSNATASAWPESRMSWPSRTSLPNTAIPGLGAGATRDVRKHKRSEHRAGQLRRGDSQSAADRDPVADLRGGVYHAEMPRSKTCSMRRTRSSDKAHSFRFIERLGWVWPLLLVFALSSVSFNLKNESWVLL